MYPTRFYLACVLLFPFSNSSCFPVLFTLSRSFALSLALSLLSLAMIICMPLGCCPNPMQAASCLARAVDPTRPADGRRHFRSRRSGQLSGRGAGRRLGQRRRQDALPRRTVLYRRVIIHRWVGPPFTRLFFYWVCSIVWVAIY